MPDMPMLQQHTVFEKKQPCALYLKVGTLFKSQNYVQKNPTHFIQRGWWEWFNSLGVAGAVLQLYRVALLIADTFDDFTFSFAEPGNQNIERLFHPLVHIKYVCRCIL